MRSRGWEQQRALREKAGREVWLHLYVNGHACSFQSLDRGSISFRREHVDLKVRALTLLDYGLGRTEIFEDLAMDRSCDWLKVTGVSLVSPVEPDSHRIILDVEIVAATGSGDR